MEGDAVPVKQTEREINISAFSKAGSIGNNQKVSPRHCQTTCKMCPNIHIWFLVPPSILSQRNSFKKTATNYAAQINSDHIFKPIYSQASSPPLPSAVDFLSVPDSCMSVYSSLK